MALCSTIHKGVKVYYFGDRFFTYKGKTFEIIGTESTGRGVHDCIHTIRYGKETKEVKMTDLLKKLLEENPDI